MGKVFRITGGTEEFWAALRRDSVVQVKEMPKKVTQRIAAPHISVDPYFHGGKGEYHPGLGQHVNNRREVRDLVKQRGLIETGGAKLHEIYKPGPNQEGYERKRGRKRLERCNLWRS